MVQNLGINEYGNKNVSTIKEAMACQAEFQTSESTSTVTKMYLPSKKPWLVKLSFMFQI